MIKFITRFALLPPVRAELREVRTPEEMDGARSVRMQVFVREQGVPVDIEMDEYDSQAIHVICTMGTEIVGTGRLVRMPDGLKIGRVAVLPQHRGEGLGREIVLWLLRRSREAGENSIYANVQMSAAGFYEKLGFVRVGEEFLEAGIRHIRMGLR